MFFKLSTIVAYAALTAASPIVPSLNEEATKEAHQRDNGATRFRSNVQIKVRSASGVSPADCSHRLTPLSPTNT